MSVKSSSMRKKSLLKKDNICKKKEKISNILSMNTKQQEREKQNCLQPQYHHQLIINHFVNKDRV